MSIPHLGPSALTQVVDRIFISEEGVEVVDVIEKNFVLMNLQTAQSL